MIDNKYFQNAFSLQLCVQSVFFLAGHAGETYLCTHTQETPLCLN